MVFIYDYIQRKMFEMAMSYFYVDDAINMQTALGIELHRLVDC
jgi:hypothetical protein